MKEITVEVFDFKRGSIYQQGDQTVFTAKERYPTVWRVLEAGYDFTFTQTELEANNWIREVDNNASN